MGQLAGIYWFDGRPIDHSTRNEALSELPEGCVFERPGLLIAWQDCSGAAVEPLQASNACLLDGKVHNFKEAASGLLKTPPSPGALALKLYERGGTAALGKLIGDWSLVLWDARLRTVVLASDYAGTRPLYFYRSPRCLAWSSSLEQLARWMDCRQLDQGYVSEFLETGFPGPLTPYCGISAVPPGSALSASPDQIAVTPFWSLPLDRPTEFRRESDYEERYREVFREAVAVRLQTGAPVAAELSGGLDSSSIVCMADRLIASAAVPAPRIATFSYLVPGSPDLDYIAIAEKACSTLAPVHLDALDYPILTPQAPGRALPVWAETRQAEVRRRMQEMGAGVLLTGQLGDLITGNHLDDSGQAADYFWRGQFGAGLKEAFAWSRSQSVPVYPILWRSLRAGAGSLIAAGRKALPTQQARVDGVSQLLSSRFFQCPEALRGVLYSHPFTHRPLVEFLLATPPAILCRPGEPRRLMRRALRGIVPDRILRRGSKGNYEGLFLQSLRDCAGRLLKAGPQLRLTAMGHARPGEVETRLTELSGGLPCGDLRIHQLIRLELWLARRIACGAISVDEPKVAQVGDRGIPQSGIVRLSQSL